MRTIIVIGRDTDNDIVINDPHISRHHLQLVKDDNGSISIIDLDSTNGVFVNGQKIAGETKLQPSDIVTIGSITVPWIEYVKTNVHESESKKSRRKYYVILAVLLVVIVAFVIGWLLISKEDNKVTTVVTEEREVQIAEKQSEAERLLDEAQQLSLKGLNKEAADLRAQANAKMKEVEALKENIDTERKRSLQTKNELAKKDQLVKEKDTQISKLKADNESKLQNTKDEANKAIANANEQIKETKIKNEEANKSAELTHAFYDQLDKTKKLEMVFEQLGLESPDKNKRRDELIRQFRNSDNNGKIEIINAMKRVAQK